MHTSLPLQKLLNDTKYFVPNFSRSSYLTAKAAIVLFRSKLVLQHPFAISNKILLGEMHELKSK